MFLKIQEINDKIFFEAQEFFGANFCEKLKNQKPGTYKESLVARYLIEKNNKKYSSISHKKNLVFIGISEKKIGVDIEILKKRDKNLLESFFNKEYFLFKNYEKQGAKDPCGKNWKNFYILWTAKESIIKYENLVLDDMKKIILEKIENKILKISGIKFDKKLIFSFKNKKILVYSGNQKKIFYSICVFGEINK